LVTGEIQEMPAKSSGKCRNENQCWTGYFKVNAEEDQGEQKAKQRKLLSDDIIPLHSSIHSS
jgi:hypothetical protein